MESMGRQTDIQSVKKRLMDYWEREREIDHQRERIKNITMKMEGLQSPEMSGMPHAEYPEKDKLGRMYARKDEMERQLKAMEDLQDSELEWIEGVLEHLEKADERACIQMRYIDMESWPKVSFLLFGKEEDYSERYESYLRRTTNLHGRALQRMAEYLQGER